MNSSKDLFSGNTLVELLQERARNTPDDKAYIFLRDGENDEVSITFLELEQQAKAIAYILHEEYDLKCGDRALLIYPPGIDLMSAYFGCLYAGVIAVLAYPPINTKAIDNLQGVATSCTPKVLLTTDDVAKKFEKLKLLKLANRIPGMSKLTGKVFKKESDFLGLSVQNLPTFVSDKGSSDLIDKSARKWQSPAQVIDGDTIAFLQFTSGSTGTPKGVMLSHGNLIHNLEIGYEGCGSTDLKMGGGWVPQYHDLGMIGTLLECTYVGIPCVFMSPLHFMEKPVRWLRMISKYKINSSAAPNFAFDLCVKQVSEEEKKSLDLSSWLVAGSGGEPVVEESLERFYQAFRECGFKKDAFYPCYGIAEATLFVSVKPHNSPVNCPSFSKSAIEKRTVEIVDCSDSDAQTLISCGAPLQELKIVNPDSCQECAAGEIGEVWIHSPSIAKGYWEKERETIETFHNKIAGNTEEKLYLRTGDLGFIHQNELYISGRIKDLIIIGGRNYYPQDFEKVLTETCEELRPGYIAAFAVDALDNETIGDGTTEEKIIIVAELNPELTMVNQDLVKATAEKIHQTILTETTLMVSGVVILPNDSIPKTVSGKTIRQECKKKFKEGGLGPVLYSWRLKHENKSPRVCIIGAGPAGLTAALRLKDKGYDKVTVLEKNKDPGGMSLGVWNQDTNSYLFYGAYLVNSVGYRQMLELGRRFNVDIMSDEMPSLVRRYDKASGKLEPDCSPVDATEYAELVSYYNEFREKVLKDYGHLLSDNHTGDLGDLYMPFTEWLEKHGWKFEFEKHFGSYLAAPGYDYDAPAYYGLLAVVAFPIMNWRLAKENSFAELWSSVSQYINDVRTNTAVNEVVRGESNVLVITDSGETLEFDQLIISCHLDDSLKFLDATEQERSLFEKLEYTDYRVALAEVPDSPQKIFGVHENFKPGRHGRPMVVTRTEDTGDIYQVVYYGNETDPQQELLKNDLNANWVKEVKRWKYFPHYNSESLKAGHLGELRKSQGKKNTYYIGASMSMEHTEHAVSYARYIIDSQFPIYLADEDVYDDMLSKARIDERTSKPVMKECFTYATFKVNSDLPSDLRIGVFEDPDREWNALLHITDRQSVKPASGIIPDIHDMLGFAIKLEETDQDFLLMSAPYFGHKNAEEFLRYYYSNNDPEAFFAGQPERLRKFLATSRPIPDALETSYWSTTPYQYGQDKVVKYALIPRDGSRSLPKTVDLDPLGWTEATSRRLALDGMVFDFCIQIQTDPEAEPIDDATVVWENAPYVRVATLTLEPQVVDRSCSKIDFNPWNCLPEHTPLGSMNLARKRVYTGIQNDRNANKHSIASREAKVAGKDQVLYQLQRIISTQLKIPVESLESRSLAELGISSMAAVSVYDALEKEFNSKFPLSTLFESESLEALSSNIANHLSASAKPESDQQGAPKAVNQKSRFGNSITHLFAKPSNPILELQPHGSGDPIVWIHAPGGAGIFYYELSQRLGKSRPIFAIEDVFEPNLLNPEFVGFTYESWASLYVSHIKAIAPNRPVILGGLSSGGVLAHEIARQLESENRKVSKVILLDSPISGRGVDTVVEDVVQIIVKYLLRGDRDESDLLPAIFSKLQKLGTMSSKLEALRNMPEWKCVAEKGKWFNNDQKLNLFFYRLINQFNAFNAYSIKPSKISTVLFCVEQRLPEMVGADFNWPPYVSDLEVYTVPGHHFNMMEAPQVELLAKKLDEVLAKGADSSEKSEDMLINQTA